MPTLAIKREVLGTASRIQSRHALCLIFTRAAGEMLVMERRTEGNSAHDIAIKRAQGCIGLFPSRGEFRAQKLLQTAATGLVLFQIIHEKRLQTENCNKKLPTVHCRHISTSHRI